MIRRNAFRGGGCGNGRDGSRRNRGRSLRSRGWGRFGSLIIGDAIIFRPIVGIVIIVFHIVSRRVLIIHDFHSDGDPAVQMSADFRSQLRAVFLEQGLLRGINEKGDLAAFGEKAHLDRAVDELVGDRQLILSSAAVAFQKPYAVLVRPGQPDHIPVPVQIHQYLGIDGEVNGGIDAEIILVIAEAEKQEQAGCGRGDGAAHQTGDTAAAGGLRLFHQHGIFYGLAHFIVEIGRFPEPALLIQKNRIAGMTFHYHVFHCAAPPFMTCLICPRMISYPLV